MTETFFVTNSAAIFGQLGPGGEVEILDSPAPGAEAGPAARALSTRASVRG
jgi:hypothetical protein